MTSLTTHKQLHLDALVSQENPLGLYDLKELLGKGSYGFVCRATNIKTGNQVAIKIISLLDPATIKDVGSELATLRECNSVHITRYYESYYQEQNLWIVMEYCEGGSISDILKRRNQPLEEDHMARIIRQTLRGLDYIHTEHHQIHRDIKGGNILLTALGEVKLADFGVSAKLQGTFAKRNTFAGTPYWMAPEVILESHYDARSDIWSLGITAIEMAELIPPFADLHPMRALFKIPKEPSPILKDRRKWSPTFQEFISRCLQKNQLLRPTARQLLDHPFVFHCKPAIILANLVAQTKLIQEPQQQNMTGDEDQQGMDSPEDAFSTSVSSMIYHASHSMVSTNHPLQNEFQRYLLSRSDSIIELPWVDVSCLSASTLLTPCSSHDIQAAIHEIDVPSSGLSSMEEPSHVKQIETMDRTVINLIKTYNQYRTDQDTVPMQSNHRLQTNNVVNDLAFHLKMILPQYSYQT